MTLADHLAKGYDAYVHGAKRGWTREMLVDDLRGNDVFRTEARGKLADLSDAMNAGRQCFVSKTQHRILTDAFTALATNA